LILNFEFWMLNFEWKKRWIPAFAGMTIVGENDRIEQVSSGAGEQVRRRTVEIASLRSQ